MARMSGTEFAEWQIIYDKFEPFGEWRNDLRAGEVAAPIASLLQMLITAATLGKVKFPKNPRPSDWLHSPADWFTPVKVKGVSKKKLPPGTMPWKEQKQFFAMLAEAWQKK